jgi:hypothetical protein
MLFAAKALGMPAGMFCCACFSRKRQPFQKQRSFAHAPKLPFLVCQVPSGMFCWGLPFSELPLQAHFRGG